MTSNVPNPPSIVAGERLDEMKRVLRDHQIGRLTETFHDLIEDPEHEEMARFFFEDLYHVEDLRERNESFLKLYNYLDRMLSLKLMRGLKSLMDFYFISERLDIEVAIVLLKMDVGYDFSREDYRRAYRYADNYNDRVEQLDVCEQSLRFVHSMSHMPFFGAFIKSAQVSATLIGATAMVDFLGRGYRLFKAVDDIGPFSDVIQDRERERLDQIWQDYEMDEAHALDPRERELARQLL